MKFLFGKEVVPYLIFYIQVCFEIQRTGTQTLPISHGVTNQGHNTKSDFVNYTNLFSLLGWEGKSRQFQKRCGDYFVLKKIHQH